MLNMAFHVAPVHADDFSFLSAHSIFLLCVSSTEKINAVNVTDPHVSPETRALGYCVMTARPTDSDSSTLNPHPESLFLRNLINKGLSSLKIYRENPQE